MSRKEYNIEKDFILMKKAIFIINFVSIIFIWVLLIVSIVCEFSKRNLGLAIIIEMLVFLIQLYIKNKLTSNFYKKILNNDYE